ncbi:glycosyltransferase family 4 protein [Candidatus Kaiserbacteria bacterium]|nr:glycosyltransferase family 4 protein [Candidatus Kaiserbacteria bacterium]
MRDGPVPIAYVTSVRLPTDRAHGYAIMKMCEQFAAHGAQVELYVPTRRHGIKEDPFMYYAIKPTFSIRKLWATDLLGKFENSRAAFALDQLTFLLSLLMHRFGNTIVYTRDYQVALFARAREIVLEIHNIPERTFLFFRALSRASKLVVISNGLKDALVQGGVPSEKIVVAPDAVDLEEFDIQPSRDIWRNYGVDPNKKIVLYTGHFYGWKGGETLANAAKYLPDGVETVLMGGVDRELAEFKKTYASDRVHVIGYQPRENMPSVTMTADVLVLPNSAKPKISSHYTSPLKLFQYMAAGVSIVASDLPSIREILTDDTAFWFAPDDERALARQIEYVLSHPDEAREKAERAADAIKQYTWTNRARMTLNHIHQP